MSFVKRFMLILGLVLVLAVPASTSLASAAFDVKGGTDCTKGNGSAICDSTSAADPLSGPGGIIRTATRIIAIIAGVAAIIVIIIAGITYITSNGEADAVSRAKKTIIFAVIGLIVIVLGQAIINFVISKV